VGGNTGDKVVVIVAAAVVVLVVVALFRVWSHTMSNENCKRVKLEVLANTKPCPGPRSKNTTGT
jgi:hypothetical protein